MTAFIPYASKVMLKILQVRLQQYMNQEFPDVQVGFRKGRGPRDRIFKIQLEHMEVLGSRTAYWSLAWRILSIILLACEMSSIVW